MEEEEEIYSGAYIIDTNIFRPLYNFIYKDVFPEIWNSIDELIQMNKFCSVAEVKKECDYQLSHSLEYIKWAKEYGHLFLKPYAEDTEMLSKIYEIPEFRMKPKDVQKNKTHADGFLVAKAKVLNGCLVTAESQRRSEQSKIPTICNHFGVKHINLHEFLIQIKDKEYLNENSLVRIE